MDPNTQALLKVEEDKEAQNEEHKQTRAMMKFINDFSTTEKNKRNIEKKKTFDFSIQNMDN